MVVLKKRAFYFKMIIIAGSVAFFNFFMFLFPTTSLTAAREGLLLWFNNVLPALLPFVIATNILIGIGFVRFVGTLLEPLMLPLFGVPGSGGFAFAAGAASGYPVGAKMVAQLRQSGELTRTEAQRLMAFCNNAGPLFLLGAVGVGMFRSVQAGYFLMLCHYGGALLTGLAFKYYKPTQMRRVNPVHRIGIRALQNMADARRADGRPFGLVMADSVKNAMETMLLIGGFIVFFCVVAAVLKEARLFAILTNGFASAHTALAEGFLVGLIEVTNGTRALSALPASKAQMLLVCAAVSFGGFSIFAQTVGFIAKTDINPAVYLLSKISHAAASVLLGYFFFSFFSF